MEERKEAARRLRHAWEEYNETLPGSAGRAKKLQATIHATHEILAQPIAGPWGKARGN